MGRTREPGEPGLRALVGAGPSQVGVGGALRARDVSRPTPADEQAARQWAAGLSAGPPPGTGRASRAGGTGSGRTGGTGGAGEAGGAGGARAPRRSGQRGRDRS